MVEVSIPTHTIFAVLVSIAGGLGFFAGSRCPYGSCKPAAAAREGRIGLLATVAATPRLVPRRLQQQQQSPVHGAVRLTSHGLVAPIHLAFTDKLGALMMPNDTQRVFVEIGCSDRDTMDADGSLERDPHAFLISFEPLLDKYAVLLARGGPRHNGRGVLDRAVPLGHHHPRGVVLPIAISPGSATGAAWGAGGASAGAAAGGAAGMSGSGGGGGGGGGAPLHHNSARRGLVGGAHASGLTTINVSRIAGCSSLVPFNENTTWGAQCFQGQKADQKALQKAGQSGMLEARQVPTLTLEAALGLAPAHLPIAKLKLDAQGLDLKLLRSARPAALQRVASLELEVVKKGCPTLYVGQETHERADALLTSLGFKATSWRWHGHLKCEGTGFFVRAPLL